MCLGIPGKIIEINQTIGVKMAKIDFGGVIREACIEAIPEAKIGDYTIIHAGFALNILSEKEALETLSLLQDISDFNNDLEPDEQEF
ncbi:MAG: HypC/HybG/HupF family hydrogenase formation chaperone [Anaerolineaceae bacterium]|nr:MAG: HypC/HybG/HupF family hydrogenase formation chaperone [Chloroflexi bacterium HGW-Chloroflexi-8]